MWGWFASLRERLRNIRAASAEAGQDTVTTSSVAGESLVLIDDREPMVKFVPGGARRAAFDTGETPLPNARSSIRPRFTGWENDEQRSWYQ